ncbi:hypothetical protein D3C81_2253430 [compost metagenome]
MAETDLADAVDGLVNTGKGSLDILLQSVIQGNSGGQPSNWLIGNWGLALAWLNQHILNNLDCRA